MRASGCEASAPQGAESALGAMFDSSNMASFLASNLSVCRTARWVRCVLRTYVPVGTGIALLWIAGAERRDWDASAGGAP